MYVTARALVRVIVLLSHLLGQLQVLRREVREEEEEGKLRRKGIEKRRTREEKKR